MKILLKFLIIVFVIFSSQLSEAASIDSWAILSPLSGGNLLMKATAPTQVTFSVTCTRSTLAQVVNISIRLRANDGKGNYQNMHSDVFIKTQEFFYGGKLNRTLTKTFTVVVEESKMYPGQTTVTLSAEGVGGMPSNSYPVIVPIENNSICCSSTYTNGTAPSVILTSTAPLKGGNGTYTYQWQTIPDSLLSDRVWVNIPNGTSESYTTPIRTKTTYYRRIVRSNSSPAVPENISLPITITINNSGLRIGAIQNEALVDLESKVSVYPNPFTDKLTIEVNNVEMKSIEIVNIEGTVIYGQNNGFDGPVEIDASAWAQGIFFLRIMTTDNKLVMRKFVKK